MENISSNSPINFASRRLYNINVEKLVSKDTYELVPAYFTELRKSSKKDQAAMKKIKENWEDGIWVNDIVKYFFSKNDSDKYYCIELKEQGSKLKRLFSPLHKRILSLAQTEDFSKSKTGNDRILYHLESNPNQSYENASREFKGGGKLCLYGVIKKALKEGVEELTAEPSNKGFWDKMKIFTKHKSKHMNIKSAPLENMKEFVTKIEQKYKIEKGAE